jgi:LAO/AO transport system kinase
MQIMSVDELTAAARAGSPRAVARLISLVEDASPDLRKVLASLAGNSGRAWVIGLTGSPGVGKSTCTSALVRIFRAEGKRVAVIAVDPSSPFTGGALLGDRIRMQEHTTDPGVYIRSLATRGHLGGLSWATPQVVRVLDGVGFDVVLIETVGVGQSEVEVAGLADTTVVLLAPGMGDGVQAAKAGILEIGDVFVVNKADREGAEATVRDLRNMLELGQSPQVHPEDVWRPSIVSTVASAGTGVREMAVALTAHHLWSRKHGELLARRTRRATGEIEAIVLAGLRERIGAVQRGERLKGLAADVVEGRTDPYSAADRLLADLVGAQQSGL